MTVILIVILIVAGILLVLSVAYGSRIRTIRSIRKLSSYEDGFDLYRMDVAYDYDLDRILACGIRDDETMMKAIAKASVPFLPVSMKPPHFECSAFTYCGNDGKVRMGRNYDFFLNTSAMLVYNHPKNGYASMGLCTLNNLQADHPLESLKGKLATLAAPFVTIDGINEKGVSIAVLTLDSKPVYQQTGKQMISTSLIIRMVLDRAGSTEEAVRLFEKYDMFASSGRDYHFYVTDASGDGRAIEYDCEDPDRSLRVTACKALTNFQIPYLDKVLPNQKNGIYGHGRERYDIILNTLDDQNPDTAWKALKAAAQDPKPGDVTSNTQWSILYNNTDLTAKMVLRRHWEDVYSFSLDSMRKDTDFS